MQIICNNCGNNLTFPNQQHLVTCSQCLTTMEIEEFEYIFTAKTLEKPIADESIFQESKNLMQIESFDEFYDLLLLEDEYDEAVEKYFTKRIISGNTYRPSLIRGIFQGVLGVVAVFYFVYIASYVSIQELSVLLLPVIGIFFIRLGIKECIRRWNFKEIEKDYFEKQKALIQSIEASRIPNNLSSWFADYRRNQFNHLDIREEYFYTKIGSRKFYTGEATISKASKFIVLGLSFGFLLALFTFGGSLLDKYDFFLIPLMWMTIIGSILLFINLIGKSRRYKKAYQQVLEEREEIISQLDDILNQ